MFDRKEWQMATENVIVVRFTDPSNAYQALSVLRGPTPRAASDLIPPRSSRARQPASLRTPESADRKVGGPRRL
jgi:hypothetical protein